MIVSRTPLRISFIGGGSDLPVHYRRYGGAVLSAAIAKYMYLTVHHRFDTSVRVSYSVTEEVNCASHVKHKLVRAALLKLGIDSGIEITSIGEIPSRGSGLGSSSAFTTGLLHCLHAYLGEYRSREQLAAEACEVEIGLCKEPIGKQDQYASAMGGVNLIRFNPDDSVTVEPVVFAPDFREELQGSLLLFYTGLTRSASDLLRQQSDAMSAEQEKCDVVRRMAHMAEEFRHAIQDRNLQCIGEMLHEAWGLKRSLTPQISNGIIDDLYTRARLAGALGGKLLGAGGGGFLLICAERDRQESVRRALSEYRCFPVKFDWPGSSIILYSPEAPERIVE